MNWSCQYRITNKPTDQKSHYSAPGTISLIDYQKEVDAMEFNEVRWHKNVNKNEQDSCDTT